MKINHTASGRCRLTLCLVVALVTNTLATAGPVTTFDDIEFWVGSGANRSALAIDWQGNSTADNSLVWGYKYDGAKKGLDMLTEILIADNRLYAKMGAISGFGYAVVGLGYDANNDGEFELSDGTGFDEHGISNDVPSDGATALNGDWYKEGWLLQNFWNYGIATSSPFDGGNWARSGTGVSSRNLANGSWDSFAFTTINQQHYAQNPLAAPAPTDADFDSDGDVDGRDFLTWQRGHGILSGAELTDGDANNDGAVDSLDLDSWSTQYGTETLSPLRLPLSALNSSLPEPSTGLLVPFVVLLLGSTRFKRRIAS